MHNQWIVKPNAEEVATAACEWLVESVQEALRERGKCSIALSGGSTPRRLFQLIAENELHCVDWSRVTLLWGDERNVPHDHPDSNYRMVREAWLDRAIATNEPRCIPRVCPVDIQVTAPDRAAFDYEQVICRELDFTLSSDDPDALPVLDIVLLGLGDDAHTASLFPETEAVTVADRLFVANYVPKFAAHRMTMTALLINAARQVAFLVCGASKTAAVDLVLHGPKQPLKYPAQLIQPRRGQLWWFLDTAAMPSR